MMAIRITVTTDDATSTIRVEGRLDKSKVPELLTVCRSIRSPLKLCLAGLTSADAGGVEVLRSLAAEGAELNGLSPYIRQLLQSDTS